MRRVIVALIAVALAAAVFFLWPRSDDVPSDGTEALGTSTTTTVDPNTTSTAETTTTQSNPTTTAESHVVETVEEAEEILRELWFGWFEGIYNQDENRIREVVGSHAFLDAASAAFGQLQFLDPPLRNGLQFEELEILETTPDCLVVWSVSRVDYLDSEAPRAGVEVLRKSDDGWKFFAAWRFRDDLWEADCESQLLPLS